MRMFYDIKLQNPVIMVNIFAQTVYCFLWICNMSRLLWTQWNLILSNNNLDGTRDDLYVCSELMDHNV